MKKQIIMLGIVVLLICVGLSGCEESKPSKIQYYGDDETLTINYPDKQIKLEVYGNNCTYTVTKKTNLVEVWIYGENSTVLVSKTHSFNSTIWGNNSKINYYD